MIDLLFLGTGAMVPMPNRPLSSILIRSGKDLILFDCGEGTQIEMRRHGWGFRPIGTILVSHTHADHVSGLPGMLHAIANANRTEPVNIHGPIGTRAVVEGLRTIAPELPFDVNVIELQAGERIQFPGALMATVAAGDHALPVLGFRFDLPRLPRFDPGRALALGIPRPLWSRLKAGESVTWPGAKADPVDVLGAARSGISFGIVTDTRPTDGLRQLVAKVDLLICEGTYGDDADGPKATARRHMTFRESATFAREAGVRELILTHFSPALLAPASFLDNATAAHPGASIATDGMTRTLAFPR